LKKQSRKPGVCRSSFAFLLAFSIATPVFADGITATYQSAGTQTPDASICATCYETFDTTSGFYADYTTNFGGGAITGDYIETLISDATAFGGAGGTGGFHQDSFANSNTDTLFLSSPANYFGMWWSSIQFDGTVIFESQGNTVASFSGADLLSAIDLDANSAAYFDNPNASFNGQDPADPFAYVNFFATGVTFDEIIFLSFANDFDSDNHALLGNYTGSEVGTAWSTVTTDSSTPEPSTLFLALTGAGLLWLRSSRLNPQGQE
jgi:hypothetical protein